MKNDKIKDTLDLLVKAYNQCPESCSEIRSSINISINKAQKMLDKKSKKVVTSNEPSLNDKWNENLRIGRTTASFTKEAYCRTIQELNQFIKEQQKIIDDVKKHSDKVDSNNDELFNG